MTRFPIGWLVSFALLAASACDGFTLAPADPAQMCNDGFQDGDETDVDCGGPCAACGDGLACSSNADCASSACVGGACRAAACGDGFRNGAETDVDCGGGECAPCAEGKHCGSPDDCASVSCVGATCTLPACTDAVKNGGETDVDCGGDACAPCQIGQACAAASECASGACVGGLCVPPTCGDGAKNGAETSVDCGGGCPCPARSPCTVPTECASLVCDRTCQPPSCSDGVKNGMEGGIDCGSGCLLCPDGESCNDGVDCASGVCVQATCHAPSCSDAVENAAETDVDCGGTCSPCASGEGCAVAADCATGVCSAALVCAAPSCADGVPNGTESSTDCGGTCPGCAVGTTCGAPGDCASGVCSGQPATCQAPTCSDAVKNAAEGDIDCGATCPSKCLSGKACAGAGDCASGVCASGMCQVPICADGVKNAAETDVDCGGACVACANGKGCGIDVDCASGHCAGPTMTCAPWSKAFAQQWHRGSAVAVDSAANVVVTGSFSDPLDLGGGTLPAAGGVFLAKYAQGGQHLWSKALGTGPGGYTSAAAVGTADDIVIAGTSDGGDFGGGYLPANPWDVVIAKYGPAGNHVWSKIFGGTAEEWALGLAFVPGGDVVVTGAFWSAALDLGGSPLVHAPAPGFNVFVARLSGATGSHVWSKAFGTDHAMGYAVAVDAAGDLFVTGSVKGPIDFGGGTLVPTPGGSQVYVAKLFGASGAHLWSHAWSPLYGTGTSIAVDSAGNVLLAGCASGGTDFGGGPLAGGACDQFVAKLAGDSGAHLWSRMFADSWATNYLRPTRVAVDATGNVIVAGGFAGSTTDFGLGTVTNAGPADTNDIFVAKYAAATGATLFAETYSSTGDDFVKGLAVHHDTGNIVVIGAFAQSIDLGAGVHAAPAPYGAFLGSLGAAP